MDIIQFSVVLSGCKRYVNLFKSEAEERGVSDRISYLFGDFTEMSDVIPSSDIVTLDRKLFYEIESIIIKNCADSFAPYMCNPSAIIDIYDDINTNCN